MPGVFTATLWLDAIWEHVGLFSKFDCVSALRIVFFKLAATFVTISIHVSYQLSQSQEGFRNVAMNEGGVAKRDN